MRMRIQRNEVARVDLRVESKAQRTWTYHNWAKEVLTKPGVLANAGVRKALDKGGFDVPICGEELCGLGITHFVLECGDVHFRNCLERVHPYTGRRGSDIFPAIVRRSWCDGHL